MGNWAQGNCPLVENDLKHFAESETAASLASFTSPAVIHAEEEFLNSTPFSSDPLHVSLSLLLLCCTLLFKATQRVGCSVSFCH